MQDDGLLLATGPEAALESKGAEKRMKVEQVAQTVSRWRAGVQDRVLRPGGEL